MAEVLSIAHDADLLAHARRAAEALRAGQLALLPADDGYVLCADARNADAFARLCQATSLPCRLAFLDDGQAAQALPSLPPLARRIMRRCWPGALTLLVCEDAAEGGLALCSPAHPAFQETLLALDGALALAPVVPKQTLPETVAVMIQDDAVLGMPGASVVRVSGDRWEMIEEKALSAARLRIQLATLLVFVCTGNTCRSPLAEALGKRKLAERLGCGVAELPERGWLVMSAGLSAYPGDAASSLSFLVGQSLGVDLAEHRSRPLNVELARAADLLVCMTGTHLEALSSYYDGLACTPRLLSAGGEDIPDPVGLDEPAYRACAERIDGDLDVLLRELIPDGGGRA